jgi:creatinine amidohydrolase
MSTTPSFSPAKFPYWADYTTLDFADIDFKRALAVLPLGAIEQHGPHLPLCVDAVLADSILHLALSKLHDQGYPVPLWVLPSLTVGYSPEHSDFEGTLSLSLNTTIALWTDMAASVSRTGFQKLFFFNAHGGHDGLLDAVGIDIRARTGLNVYHTSWYKLVDRALLESLFGAENMPYDIHAGAIETSMMLYLRPDLVRMDLAQNFESSTMERDQQSKWIGRGRSKFAWLSQDLHPSGASGNSAEATAEKGQILVEASALALSELILELIAQETRE